MDDVSGHVTVALSVFNGAPFVGRAVESIARQDYEHFDLYVVDDASEDETFETVLPLAQADSRVHLIRLRQNIGTYAAKNLVLRKFCRGEFFAHQDADDFSSSERLRKQVGFLRKRPEFAACGTAIDEFFESPGQIPRIPGDAPILFSAEDRCFHRENRYPRSLGPGDFYAEPLNDLAKIKLAMNGSLMFRSACLRELGGFDGRSRVAGDTELLWRLLRQHKLANLPDVLYSRRFHAASLTRSAELGFSSKARRDYIVDAQKKLMEHTRSFPGRVFSREFYYPEVEFEQYS